MFCDGQDTVKYVENQMRTVGASVKRFYSDVMEDLLPPSSLDPMKEEHSSIVEKTKVENEGDSVNSITEQMMRDSDSLANGVNTINHWTSSPVCSVNKPYEPTFRNSVEEQCADKNLESQFAENNLSNLHSYLPKDLDDRKDPDQNSPDIARLNTFVKSDPAEELTCSEVFSKIDEPLSELRGDSSKLTSVLEVNESQDGLGILEDMTDGSAVAAAESKTTISSSRDISANMDETSIPSLASEIANVDAGNRGVLDSKQFDKMKLGESCVLVEKSEHPFKLSLADERKLKSYKKKIRDVFSPRRWSKGKQDQEQLAVSYEEQTANKLIATSVKHAGVSDSRQHEPLELEWELL
ncbi:hypothetical protein Cgig2_020757 [Carnegiea gigantea]|uniref:Uncharacterized protein n=1 Tax=Carnegiea gigantea TaxID=171969 RepID=A0A9Q1K240_9CARY|nr:hypothetical protein Cgig2_020757 [Carnegiea gigantea]